MPLDTKGSGVSLANLPINIIDRIEIYKGVVPASLGTDALGGAINIITKQEKGLSGCILRHRLLPYPQGRLECTVRRKKTGLIVRPTVGINYSKTIIE